MGISARSHEYNPKIWSNRDSMKKKILLIGGNGTIGKHVKKALKDHFVLVAGRSAGDFRVDISDVQSIENVFKEIKKLDAIVCIAGTAKWALMSNMSEDDYYIGIRSKLMGQVNLTRIGVNYLNSGGSITLSTGILAEDPVLMTTSAAMVNGALHSFVKAASLELKNEQRINVVAAGLVEDSAEKYTALFPGHNRVPMQQVSNAYLKGILGSHTGKVIRAYR